VRTGCSPKFAATTDSDHNGPIFPDMAKNMELSGRDQLWVADLTYVAIPSGFVYVAVILDAWSRRLVGYAIGRSIDAHLALAALRAAIASRRPPPGCVHHSDRGAQYTAEAYRELLPVMIAHVCLIKRKLAHSRFSLPPPQQPRNRRHADVGSRC
jgi:putative transposase